MQDPAWEGRKSPKRCIILTLLSFSSVRDVSATPKTISLETADRERRSNSFPPNHFWVSPSCRDGRRRRESILDRGALNPSIEESLGLVILSRGEETSRTTLMFTKLQSWVARLILRPTQPKTSTFWPSNSLFGRGSRQERHSDVAL